MKSPDKKPLDLNKARQSGIHGPVENLNFSDPEVAGKIFNAIQTLWQDLKGASPDDYDELFRRVASVKMLEAMRDHLKPIVENLDRIIEKKSGSQKP